MNIDFIIPSYHSKGLTSLCIRSFEKYKNNFEFRYIVVENASDESYKDEILSLSENVVWVSNQQKCCYLAAAAHAEAIEVGLEHVQSDLVFMCHNDVVACHENWMNYLYEKIQKGYSIAGTFLDNTRINAVHSSGMLLTTELAKKVSCFPILREGHPRLEGLTKEKIEEIKSTRKTLDVKDEIDVCDAYTAYCNKFNLKYFCSKNTFNNNVDFELPNSFTFLTTDRAVDDSGNIIFMHLGRGTLKKDNRYFKRKKTTYSDWKSFVEKEILGE